MIALPFKAPAASRWNVSPASAPGAARTIAALALAVGILRWSGGPIHETFGEVKSVVAVNDARGAGQVASVALGDGRIVTAWVRPEHATKAGERVRILSLGRPISGGPAYEVVGRKET
jgi:hypothetical protein